MLHKLAAFSDVQIDGHSPLLSSYDLNAYIAAGVRNCHETTSAAEAREKLAKGMQILIREGTVSKDLAALAELLTTERAPFLALCTDDRNPLDIAEEGHIDYLIRAAIGRGVRPLDAYRAATWSAARHFGLFDRGLVAPGQRADIVLAGGSRHCQGPLRDLPRRAGDAGPLQDAARRGAGRSRFGEAAAGDGRDLPRAPRHRRIAAGDRHPAGQHPDRPAGDQRVFARGRRSWPTWRSTS